MEVLPGIHSLESTMGPRPLFLYILRGERTILVDTGLPDTPDTVIFPYLKQIGVRPAEVDMAIITHGDVDHFGGNYALKQTAPKSLIVSHRIDMAWASDKQIAKVERYQMFEEEHGVGYDPDTLAWIMGMAGPAEPVDIGITGGNWFGWVPNGRWNCCTPLATRPAT
jgi:glyoxylase-like metal-dependent hydrolase (beta-lactamase superfamily II)